jgi:hypothetical protein
MCSAVVNKERSIAIYAEMERSPRQNEYKNIELYDNIVTLM